MSKQLNALEKEFLIRRFKTATPKVTVAAFCRANDISEIAFRKWLKIYNEEGLEGLYRASNKYGNKNPPILPEGMKETEENYKREIFKLRIENERLKKNYTVQTNQDGEKVFVCLKDKNSKS